MTFVKTDASPVAPLASVMDTEKMLLERETQLAALVGYAEEARKPQGRLVPPGTTGSGKERGLPCASCFRHRRPGQCPISAAGKDGQAGNC